MVNENVKKFFEEVSKNEDLQNQLKAATEKQEAEIAKAVKAQAEAVVEVAKKAGFDFTPQEMLEQASGDKKLDINELDAVAGGQWTGLTCCCFLGFGAGFGCEGGGSWCALIGAGLGCTRGGM